MSKTLSAYFGVPEPRSVSQRDIPGWTRATIPILHKNGIIGMSEGAGNPPGMPDLPPIFTWRDVASGTEIVVTYEGGYGGEGNVFVLPNGIGMTAIWNGDNGGPGNIPMVNGAYSDLRKKYPNAKVTSGSFGDFFEKADPSQLPVITKELGDAWIYGISTDPRKTSMFRAFARARTKCLLRKECSLKDSEMQAFDRLILKAPEHTWGIAQGWFLPDYVNWTNADFDKAVAQAPRGPIHTNNTFHADYNTTIESWLEQRSYVEHAPRIVKDKYPGFYGDLKKEMEIITSVKEPKMGEKISKLDQECAGLSFTFNEKDGSLLKLIRNGESLINSSWASVTYQTVSHEDYVSFMYNMYGDHHICTKDDKGHACGNFNKQNMTTGVHREVEPSLESISKIDGDSCVFVSEAAFPSELHKVAGAPIKTYTIYNFTEKQIDIEVRFINKRATRLPEATYISFDSLLGEFDLDILDSKISPRDMYADSTHRGLSPHLHGVQGITLEHSSQSIRIQSLDAPLLSVGEYSAFPTPRDVVPEPRNGYHFNIHNNIWNTNYPLWYPFLSEDANFLSRFSITFL